MNEIVPFLHGCRDIMESDGSITPSRFSENERAFYENLAEFLKVRSMCTAGISLQFETDVDEIVMDCFFDFFMRDEDTISIFENDVETQIYKIRRDDEHLSFNYRRRVKSRSKIIIYFPSLCCMSFKNLNIKDLIPLEKRSRLMAVYGDSISQGVEPNSSSNSYTNIISRELNCELINLSIGGFYFDERSLINTIDDVDSILIAYGTNDWTKKEIDEIEINIEMFLKKIKRMYEFSTVYCMSPLWRADLDDGVDKMTKISEKIRTECLKNNLIFIDGFKMMEHDKNLLRDKKIHPNDDGFLQISNNLLNIIK